MSQKIDVKNVSSKDRIRKFSPVFVPSVEDVRKVFQCATTDQERLIILLAYQNGLTSADIADLCVGQYPLEPWQVYVGDRPMSRFSWCGVSTPEIVKYLQSYLVVRGGVNGDPLFVNKKGLELDCGAVSKILSTVVKRVSALNNYECIWVGFGCRSLRDGFFNALVDGSVCRFLREDLMGHSFIRMKLKDETIRQRKFGNLVVVMQGVYPSLSLT